MSDWYSELPRAGESYPVKKKKPRSGRAWATRIVVVIGFFAFMFGVYAVVNRGHDWLQAKAAETTSTSLATSVKVTISPGMTATQIGQLLEDKGVIGSAAAFVDLVASRGSEAKLLPGTYQLPTRAQLVAIADKLEKGQGATSNTTTNTFKVTIPEGLAASQVGSLLAKAGNVKAAATYLNLSQQPDKFVVPKIGGTETEVITLEGLLFPDTYELMTGDGPTELIGSQLAAFSKKTASLPWANAETLGITPYQIVIVASLVEKEAVTAGDRAMVAAVIYNRLKKKMALGLDVTVRYAVENWNEPLTDADLKIDSPYNTRVKKGLPAGPIANPGLVSLKAALQPADVNYLYFLADKDGKMYFTADHKEFLKLKTDVGP